jgi:hypothetical protein
MLFTAKRVTQEKRRSDGAFRQILRCTENFALWTVKWVAKAAHGRAFAIVNLDAA